MEKELCSSWQVNAVFSLQFSRCHLEYIFLSIAFRLFSAVGPAIHTRFDRPSYPRFSWNTRNCPCTGGKRSQESYALSVQKLFLDHDVMPINNVNRVPKEIQSSTLLTQLYDRTIDSCRSTPDVIIKSHRGSKEMVGALIKCVPLLVISAIYDDFSSVLQTARGSCETFNNFEIRFAALVVKYSVHIQFFVLMDWLIALLLFANANVSSSQQSSIFSVASSKPITVNEKEMWNDKCLSWSSIKILISSIVNVTTALNIHLPLIVMLLRLSWSKMLLKKFETSLGSKKQSLEQNNVSLQPNFETLNRKPVALFASNMAIIKMTKTRMDQSKKVFSPINTSQVMITLWIFKRYIDPVKVRTLVLLCTLIWQSYSMLNPN